MKAFLLAAGVGSRLRPITDHTPKCLVPVKGKPLLEWWFLLMQKHGVTDFLINTHHLAGQVENFVKGTAPVYGLKYRLAHEPQLIGSAGTLGENFDFVKGEEDFFVFYADNLTNSDLTRLWDFHKASRAEVTMALYRMDHPETRGIAEVDRDGRIVSFVEKPKQPKSDLANGGLYVMNRSIERLLNGAFDIGYDVLPKLSVGFYGIEMPGAYHRDIGTPESLAAANLEWPETDTRG
jgi:mannose-1-phosphate guanylyltransferase